MTNFLMTAVKATFFGQRFSSTSKGGSPPKTSFERGHVLIAEPRHRFPKGETNHFLNVDLPDHVGLTERVALPIEKLYQDGQLIGEAFYNGQHHIGEE